ncbi:hypothetical protein BOX15_Mlig001484g2 [Macrostomum lignano]|uniref:Uncharacterized protein n=1 Tax=Macrostomum lignano TaxID=282301 RepID=A0A267F2L6_9PLAT|nr:hypothetical protein BOX15_Mlig001484g2 [Macrostomum lignano]
MSEEPLSEQCASQLEAALHYTSETLYARLGPLARSCRQGDQYECINACVFLISSAASQRHVSREARLATFREGRWSEKNCCQSQESMVEAGFYYLGEADYVKCFFCDLGLRDWNPAEIAEMEHANFSPLCFFLKASRGLDWLRSRSNRPQNYPTSYLRQDHNGLMRQIKQELDSPYAVFACGSGFNDTKVMLCIARRYIRQGAKMTLQELITELQAEWDREMLGGGNSSKFSDAGPNFPGQFDLAATLRSFRV